MTFTTVPGSEVLFIFLSFVQAAMRSFLCLLHHPCQYLVAIVHPTLMFFSQISRTRNLHQLHLLL